MAISQDTQQRPPLPYEDEKEVDVLRWVAPNRPFKKRDRQYYTTVAIIVFLLSLILLFAGQFLPIAVVLSVGFVSYVLASVPPERITNAFTTYGVYSDQQFFDWTELGRFWFTSKFNQVLLHIETNRFPGQMTILLGDLQIEDVRKVLKTYLYEQAPSPSFLDDAAKWLQDKFPLDREQDKEVPVPPKES